MYFMHGANVVLTTPLRQLAALAQGGFVHGGVQMACCRF
jgi:hypothetical protein